MSGSVASGTYCKYIAYLVLFTEKYCFIVFDFKKRSFLISSEFILTSHRGSLRILYTKISLLVVLISGLSSFIP